VTDHPSRFKQDKGYQGVLFAGDRFGHSYDFNDMQSIAASRIKSVADIWVKDGGVVDGATVNLTRMPPLAAGVTAPVMPDNLIYTPDFVVVQAAAGRVYAQGMVHDVPARTFIISGTRTIKVGICVSHSVVDYTTDTDLKGQVVGTRAYGQPGADRQKVEAAWTWDGAVPACDGAFFGVYTIVDGDLLTVAPPLDPLDDRIARYDREANGHYIVSGWFVTPLGYNAVDKAQRYSIGEGVINVWGYKRERKVSLRLNIPENPETNHVPTEPHIIPVGQTGATIFTNHGPVVKFRNVTILRQKTVSLTHGAYAGIADPLPDTSIAALINVVQGSKIYVQGTDFIQTGDSVDWRAIGTDEPAPGSTYQVTYHYFDQIIPADADWTPSSVTVTNAVPGSTVLLNYDWSLPRIDIIAVDRDGVAHYIIGQSSLYAPIPPSTPLDMLAIAYVTNRWGQLPDVKNVGTRAVHNTMLELHSSMIGDLYDLVAQERLKRDMDSKQRTSKRGVFVDPFLDDDMRDQGLPQTAAIFGSTLRLPIAVKVDMRTIQRRPSMLRWTEEMAINQPLFSSSMKVNPYQSFAPLPASVHLDPAMDTWVEFNSTWASSITRDVVTVQGTGWASSTTKTGSSVDVETLRNETTEARTIRVLDVLFDIEGFGAGEILASVTFDSVPVTPRIDPAIGTPLVADAQGRLRGIFTIPANIPVGAKTVILTGAGGTLALGSYVGSGKITTQVMRLVTTDTYLETHWTPRSDPLAQTFVLSEAKHIAGVDIWFTAIGDRNQPCIVQIRECSLGLPTRSVIAELKLDMRTVETGRWTHVPFVVPSPTVLDAEYAIVVLTDDASHALAIAGVGDFDAVNQRYVTQQAYQVGVLLSSSNASTWTPHNNADMTFRVYTAKFEELQKEIPVPQSVQLTNCSDLIINVGIDEPSVRTQVMIKITRANGDILYARPGQPIVFATPANDLVALSIIAKGSVSESPIIYPWVQIIQGTIASTGTYISRAMPAGNVNAPQNIVVTFDCLLPTTSNVSVDVGSPGNWQAMTQHSVTQLGDGRTEKNYTISNYTQADARIRLTLNGSSAARPEVSSLRANVTSDPINIITGQ
jgi:hypothetical protein